MSYHYYKYLKFASLINYDMRIERAVKTLTLFMFNFIVKHVFSRKLEHDADVIVLKQIELFLIWQYKRIYLNVKFSPIKENNIYFYKITLLSPRRNIC